jgi:uncharacterized protein (DUF433 family)
MIGLKLDPQLAPLYTDDFGTIRVGETRVRLNSVVYSFNQGHTAEEILMQFPSLELADIYGVIAYYLNNQSAVDEYILEYESESGEIRQEIEARPGSQDFRKRLLAQKRQRQKNN